MIYKIIFLIFLIIIYPIESVSNVCVCKDLRIAIDVGHTSFATGATSARGRSEFDFNLNMGQLLKDQLMQNGFKNTFLIINPPNLMERVKIADKQQADLFISIHHDSVQPFYLKEWTFNNKTQKYSDAFRGFSVLVSTKSLQFDESFSFAKMVGTNFRKAGFQPAYHHSKKVAGGRHNLLDEELGIYQFDKLVVLINANMPAVLIEFGVIVHRDEELMLEQTEIQAKMRHGIVDAVNQYAMIQCP